MKNRNVITCAFAGHRQVHSAEVEKKVGEILEALLLLGDRFEFLCGGMGEFDSLCAAQVRRLKKEHSDKYIRLCLVTPYLLSKLDPLGKDLLLKYDEILFPSGIESVFWKQAIPARNRWMVDHADFLIAYVLYPWGGAYQTLCYAQKTGSWIFRLAV